MGEEREVVEVEVDSSDEDSDSFQVKVEDENDIMEVDTQEVQVNEVVVVDEDRDKPEIVRETRNHNDSQEQLNYEVVIEATEEEIYYGITSAPRKVDVVSDQTENDNDKVKIVVIRDTEQSKYEDFKEEYAEVEVIKGSEYEENATDMMENINSNDINENTAEAEVNEEKQYEAIKDITYEVQVTEQRISRENSEVKVAEDKTDFISDVDFTSFASFEAFDGSCRGRQGEKTEELWVVVVTNLSLSLNESHLLPIFSIFGKVRQVVKEKDSARVTFSCQQEAKEACGAWDRRFLGGRMVRWTNSLFIFSSIP